MAYALGAVLVSVGAVAACGTGYSAVDTVVYDAVLEVSASYAGSECAAGASIAWCVDSLLCVAIDVGAFSVGATAFADFASK